jgi:hypothetical protein
MYVAGGWCYVLLVLSASILVSAAMFTSSTYIYCVYILYVLS